MLFPCKQRVCIIMKITHVKKCSYFWCFVHMITGICIWWIYSPYACSGEGFKHDVSCIVKSEAQRGHEGQSVLEARSAECTDVSEWPLSGQPCYNINQCHIQHIEAETRCPIFCKSFPNPFLFFKRNL